MVTRPQHSRCRAIHGSGTADAEPTAAQHIVRPNAPICAPDRTTPRNRIACVSLGLKEPGRGVERDVIRHLRHLVRELIRCSLPQSFRQQGFGCGEKLAVSRGQPSIRKDGRVLQTGPNAVAARHRAPIDGP
jgi:hypothetical protein